MLLAREVMVSIVQATSPSAYRTSLLRSGAQICFLILCIITISAYFFLIVNKLGYMEDILGELFII